MRLVVLFTAFALLSLALETAVPYWLPARVLVPNLVVILAVDLGLRHHGALSVLMAFAMGYATDAFSGTHLGLNAFLMTLIFLLTYEMSRRLLVTNALVGAMAVFLGVLISSLGALALGSGADVLLQAGSRMPMLLGQAAITAIVAPAVFSLLARCKRSIGLPAGPARE